MVTKNSVNEVTAASGKILQAQGVGVASAFSTATYPATAGTSGNVIQSNGTNFTSATLAGSGITTISGDVGSISAATSFLYANSGSAQCGASVSFTAASSSEMDLGVTDANFNVFIGKSAGASGNTGGSNTSLGHNSLPIIQTAGLGNTALGKSSLSLLTTGTYNNAIGYNAGHINTGNYNVYIGSNSGASNVSSESSNIYINNAGAVESNTLRIGSATGTGTQQLNKAFICGIQTITVTGTAILVSSSNQLGIAVSSKRYKLDVQDMGKSSDPVLALRPVTFVWNKDSAPGLKDATDDRQFGLIAEETHDIFPYLCTYDDNKEPFSVKYHEMPAILLNEIQKLNKRIAELESKRA